MLHNQFQDLQLSALGFGAMRLPLLPDGSGAIDQAELDRMAEWIEPGMKEHLERWAPYNDGKIITEVPSDPEEAWNYWKRRIDRMKNTMAKRPGLLYRYVQEFFGMDDAEMAVYFE